MKLLSRIASASLTVISLAVLSTGCTLGTSTPIDKNSQSRISTAPVPESSRDAKSTSNGRPPNSAEAKPPINSATKTEKTDSVPTKLTPHERAYVKLQSAPHADPYAIVESAEMRCEALKRTLKLDRNAVISQLMSAQDRDSQSLVELICPELLPQLTAASKGFTDGTYSVVKGTPKDPARQVSAGHYTAWNPSASCRITVYGKQKNDHRTYNGSKRVSITENTVRVVSAGCYAWLKS